MVIMMAKMWLSEVDWHFRILSPGTYELVYMDLGCPSSGFMYCTGYVSNNLEDILEAEWYLKGLNIVHSLNERQFRLLDDIQRVSQKRLAAYAAAHGLEIHL